MSQPKLKARIVLSLLVALVLLGILLGVFASGRLKQARAATDITISEFPLPKSYSDPTYITTGSDGNVWFTEDSGDRIGRITPNGTLTEYSLLAGSSPYSITAGPDGNLWFTEAVYGAGKIGRITPSGVVTEFALPNTASGWPFYITTGSDGNLWFTESVNKIGRITLSGVITEFAIRSAALVITHGPDGNLWFTEFGANQIGRITPQGVTTEFPLSANYYSPKEITAGPDGNLWFTESGNNIGRITPQGMITEFPTPINSSSYAITAGPDGNIWFTEADYSKNSIGRITPQGVVTEFPISTASSNPYGITAGPDGNVWFTEFRGDKIGRVNLSVATPTPSPTMSPTAIPTVAPTQPPAPQRQKLFVLAEGVMSSSNGTNSFYAKNGIYEKLKRQYSGAGFLNFSYTGSDGNGNPKAYSCQNTFDHHLSYYVSLLRKQILAYLSKNPNTQVYVIGHSMGGDVAFGLLADMVAHGFIPQIAGVVTMDSPLGGIPAGINNAYLWLTVTQGYQKTKDCAATAKWNYQQFYDLIDLTKVFGNVPHGTNGSLAQVISGAKLTNLQVAQAAKKHGISVLTLENLKDFLYQTSSCPVIKGVPIGYVFFLRHLNFIDTQLIHDQGVNSGIYGRPFATVVKGGATCNSVFHPDINHGAVFTYALAISDILQFAEGGVPKSLM